MIFFSQIVNPARPDPRRQTIVRDTIAPNSGVEQGERRSICGVCKEQDACLCKSSFGFFLNSHLLTEVCDYL